MTDATVRLASRTIVGSASAKLPPRGRIEPIGCNGVGRTTLIFMVAVAQEAKTTRIEMRRDTTLGDIAQGLLAGSAMPLGTAALAKDP